MAAIGTSWNSRQGLRIIAGEVQMPDGSVRIGVRSENLIGLQLLRPNEVDDEIRRDTADYESRTRALALRDHSLAEATRRRERLESFLAQFSPAPRAKASAVLTKTVSMAGKLSARFVAIEQRVDEGWRVTTTPKGERRFYGPDGRFLTEKDVTKIGLDYAEFLRSGTHVSGGKRRRATPSLAAQAEALRNAMRK